MQIKISLDDQIENDEVLEIYNINQWSSAQKPKRLLASLRHSHSLVTARLAGKLIGIGNTLSDGYLVVYYSHLLVHLDYQRQGIGRKMMQALQGNYINFHQQILTADEKAIPFYQSLGFVRAGKTEPMWIYAGTEHSSI